jgi:hypothetical protein
MPGFVVHQGAVVTCLHAGMAQPTAVQPRVRVSGLAVAVTPFPYTVAGCTLASVPSPPCVVGQWTLGAVRVRSLGMPLVINSGVATCVPTGTGLIVASQQVRVTAT